MAGQDEQLLAILEHDELYRVERVLADKPGCKTELVWRGIEGPFVRKRIPRALAVLLLGELLQQLHAHAFLVFGIAMSCLMNSSLSATMWKAKRLLCV